ncbi:MAG: hypothetical protein LC776_12945 [Acidobacteria bacterium]|nr:hypothetical protein [Acidobacteriota bacterium]
MEKRTPRPGGDDTKSYYERPEGGGRLTSVFIIAASEVVRAGLETLIGSDERFTVTGSAADWEVLAEAPPPDVVLLELGDASGISFAELRNLEEEGADADAPALVALMADLREERITDALDFGVRAALPRNSTSDQHGDDPAGTRAVLLHFDRHGQVRRLSSHPCHFDRHGQVRRLSSHP